MRRHPYLFGLVFLVIIGMVAFFLIHGVIQFREGQRLLFEREVVAVVLIEGPITDSRDIVSRLEQYRESEDVKAIVVRIDSPGGAVVPSQEIYDTIRSIREEKPVVASMGSVAASGGYYVACPAHEIMANPGTITGSIGVLIQFSNVEELLEKIGFKAWAIKSGKFKDTGSPFRPMEAEERKLVQELVDDIYQQFLDAVSKNRNIPMERLRTIADGRILSGRQALEAGLVDRLGNLEEAVKRAAALAGIEGKPRVIYPKRSRSIIRYFIEETAAAIADVSGVAGTGISYRYRP
ncbi:MAG: signal peptide peptidase SppA [Deltaproteobacteria bacterium]|nr:signal peptide peptidase SppA [Deltaproteobacteria bacterium]